MLGTGGHARSCLDAAICAGVEVLGCIGPPPEGELQVPYLGGDDLLGQLREKGAAEAFVAIGANSVRRRLTEQVADLGYTMRSIVSPHAYVAPTATVGDGAVVLHRAVVGPYSSVGAGAIVNTAASLDHDCALGDFAHVAPGTHLAGGVTIAEGAFLGVGCSVIPGIAVGAWATAGAGATVVRDVPPGTTVVGTPARERGNQ
jgi:UDP-perosamine 4-acetyltransferase